MQWTFDGPHVLEMADPPDGFVALWTTVAVPPDTPNRDWLPELFKDAATVTTVARGRAYFIDEVQLAGTGPGTFSCQFIMTPHYDLEFEKDLTRFAQGGDAHAWDVAQRPVAKWENFTARILSPRSAKALSVVMDQLR